MFKGFTAVSGFRASRVWGFGGLEGFEGLGLLES